MGWATRRFSVPDMRSPLMASKPGSMPIKGPRRAMKLAKEGMEFPLVVYSFRNRKLPSDCAASLRPDMAPYRLAKLVI